MILPKNQDQHSFQKAASIKKQSDLQTVEEFSEIMDKRKMRFKERRQSKLTKRRESEN